MALMDFQENGTLATNQSPLEWECVREADGALMVAMGMQGSTYDLKVEFPSDDEILLSVMLGEQLYSTKKYVRVKETAGSAVKTETATEVSDTRSNNGGQ
jgi:hypothetical protein